MIKKTIALLGVLLGLHAGSVFAGAWEEIVKAAEDGKTEVVAQLIERGMDVNTSDRAGNTLLMIAVRNGNEGLAEYLLKNRANPSMRNKYGDSALLMATMAGNLRLVKDLVVAGASVSGKGWQPLHYAAVSNRSEVTDYLLKAGAPIDAKAPNGRTALMLAVQEGHGDIARKLLQQGADASLVDGDGMTAAAIAAAKGKSDLVALFAAHTGSRQEPPSGADPAGE